MSGISVVPYVGTWIEFDAYFPSCRAVSVVPYVGTWIEIMRKAMSQARASSRSLRGNVDRNKKPKQYNLFKEVVPYVGTWIEILYSIYNHFEVHGRSLRGNVDRNNSSSEKPPRRACRSLRGNVDRNFDVKKVNFNELIPSFPTWERG